MVNCGSECGPAGAVPWRSRHVSRHRETVRHAILCTGGRNILSQFLRYRDGFSASDEDGTDYSRYHYYRTDPDGIMRLSTDIRFQNVRDEIDARWSNHWSLDDML